MKRTVTIEIDSCWKCPFNEGGVMSPSYCTYRSPFTPLMDMNGDNCVIDKTTSFPEWCELEIIEQ